MFVRWLAHPFVLSFLFFFSILIIDQVPPIRIALLHRTITVYGQSSERSQVLECGAGAHGL